MRELYGNRNGRRQARPTRPVWPTLRRALRLIRPYRLVMLGYLITIALGSLAGLGQPLLIREIIDQSIPQANVSQLNLLILAIMALVALTTVNSVLQSYLSNLASHSIMFDLRRQIYKHLTGMSLRWFTSNRTGESISRMNNDVGGIDRAISDTLGGLVNNLITVGSTLAVMVSMDWRLALFSVVFAPIFIIPARRVGNLQRQLVSETQEQMAGMNNQMEETLSISGALLVKTFGRQEEEYNTFERTARNIRDLNVRRALIGRWFTMSINLFGSIAPAVVYWYGGHQIIGGEASLGTIVAEANLLGRLFGPISSLLGIHISVLSSVALFERIFDYLDLTHEITDGPQTQPLQNSRGNIRFEKVSFSYVKDHPTLQDISFEVPAGKFAALVGPTGAGKT
ncbi:MAG: ABC transporter ATP-binding protein, partial [Chloroflexi bacterium]|nr:ABC transporter ATP-binding protein [Chloroflexota bacterium]